MLLRVGIIEIRQIVDFTRSKVANMVSMQNTVLFCEIKRWKGCSILELGLFLSRKNDYVVFNARKYKSYIELKKNDKWQERLERKEWTGKIGQKGLDRTDLTNRIGQEGLDRKDWAGRVGKKGLNMRKDWIGERIGQEGLNRKERAGRTEQEREGRNH